MWPSAGRSGLLATVRHGAVGVIQDHLYVAGADDATGAPVTETAALYVPEWPVLPLALRPRMPTPRGGGVAALVDGRIVAIEKDERLIPGLRDSMPAAVWVR